MDTTINELNLIYFALLGVMVWIVWQLRNGLATLSSFLKIHLTTSVEVTSDDPLFHPVQHWLLINVNPHHVRVGKRTRSEQDESTYYLGAGRHLVWRAWKPVIVTSKSTPMMFDNRSQHILTMRTIGRDRSIWDRLIQDAQTSFDNTHTDQTTMYLTQHGGWNLFCHTPIRKPETLFLPNSGGELMGKVERFLSSEDWYTERGITYKMGFLLYGLPGNGKTSFVRVIAGMYNLSIGIVDLTSIQSDAELLRLFAECPARILLIEDVDHHVNNEKDVQGGVTTSGLLNALDGVSFSNGTIIVLTTNNRNAIPPGLLRPGRIDLMTEFGNATAQQAGAMIARHWGDVTLALTVTEGVEFGHYSMSLIQSYLLAHPEYVANKTMPLSQWLAQQPPNSE